MGWKVTTEPQDEPVTLAEAKLHLRVDASTEDDGISQIITAAREECEQQIDRSIAVQTLQLILDAFPDGAIKLPRGPVSSIGFVKYVAGDGTLTTLDPSAYALDDAGIDAWVLPAYGYTWPATRLQANAVQVQYLAGWAAASCPASLKQWILLRVGSLFEYREADSERPAMESPFAQRIIDRWRVPGV